MRGNPRRAARLLRRNLYAPRLQAIAVALDDRQHGLACIGKQVVIGRQDGDERGELGGRGEVVAGARGW